MKKREILKDDQIGKGVFSLSAGCHNLNYNHTLREFNDHVLLMKIFFLENKFIFIQYFVTTTACFPRPLYQQGLGKPAIAYENLSITHSLIITRCPVITHCAIITC